MSWPCSRNRRGTRTACARTMATSLAWVCRFARLRRAAGAPPSAAAGRPPVGGLLFLQLKVRSEAERPSPCSRREAANPQRCASTANLQPTEAANLTPPSRSAEHELIAVEILEDRERAPGLLFG